MKIRNFLDDYWPILLLAVFIALAMIALAVMSAYAYQAILYISAHGLKSVVDRLWNGPP